MNKYETTIASTALAIAIAALVPAETVMAQEAGIEQSASPYVLINRNLPSGESWELHLVETTDEIYVPIGLRKPEGDGPFPVILIGAGAGNDGMGKIENAMVRIRELMGRLVERGYVAAFVSYRNEVPNLYNETAKAMLIDDDVSGGNRRLRSVAALDSDDHLAIIEHAKGLPYTNPDAIGAIGSSHSGEIIMKTATHGNSLAAAVPSEAAVTEYLAVDISEAPRDASGRGLQLRDAAYVRTIADKKIAMQRLPPSFSPISEKMTK